MTNEKIYSVRISWCKADSKSDQSVYNHQYVRYEKGIPNHEENIVSGLSRYKGFVYSDGEDSHPCILAITNYCRNQSDGYHYA